MGRRPSMGRDSTSATATAPGTRSPGPNEGTPKMAADVSRRGTMFPARVKNGCDSMASRVGRLAGSVCGAGQCRGGGGSEEGHRVAEVGLQRCLVRTRRQDRLRKRSGKGGGGAVGEVRRSTNLQHTGDEAAGVVGHGHAVRKGVLVHANALVRGLDVRGFKGRSAHQHRVKNYADGPHVNLHMEEHTGQEMQVKNWVAVRRGSVGSSKTATTQPHSRGEASHPTQPCTSQSNACTNGYGGACAGRHMGCSAPPRATHRSAAATAVAHTSTSPTAHAPRSCAQRGCPAPLGQCSWGCRR